MCVGTSQVVPEEMGEKRKERECMEEEKEIVVVMVMSCVLVVEQQCGYGVLTFVCTRQVHAGWSSHSCHTVVRLMLANFT